MCHIEIYSLCRTFYYCKIKLAMPQINKNNLDSCKIIFNSCIVKVALLALMVVLIKV